MATNGLEILPCPPLPIFSTIIVQKITKFSYTGKLIKKKKDITRSSYWYCVLTCPKRSILVRTLDTYTPHLQDISMHLYLYVSVWQVSHVHMHYISQCYSQSYNSGVGRWSNLLYKHNARNDYTSYHALGRNQQDLTARTKVLWNALRAKYPVHYNIQRRWTVLSLCIAF